MCGGLCGPVVLYRSSCVVRGRLCVPAGWAFAPECAYFAGVIVGDALGHSSAGHLDASVSIRHRRCVEHVRACVCAVGIL